MYHVIRLRLPEKIVPPYTADGQGRRKAARILGDNKKSILDANGGCALFGGIVFGVVIGQLRFPASAKRPAA